MEELKNTERGGVMDSKLRKPRNRASEKDEKIRQPRACAWFA